MNEDFKLDKAESIEKVINKQKEEEIANLGKQRRAYEVEIEKLNKEWKQKMDEREKELREKLTEKFEKETSLREADLEWKKNLEFDKLKATFEKQLKLTEIEYQRKIDSYSSLSAELKSALEDNENLKKKIQAIREDFQTCIERFSSLRKEEAEFLFPIEIN
jgi:chromosome segregation ATPase